MRTYTFTVSKEQSGGRLDQLIAQAVPQLSRIKARELLAKGGVFVDNKRVKVASRAARAGQRVTVHSSSTPAASENEGQAWDVPLLALTTDYVVVNKPSGLASAPTLESDRQDVIWFLRERLKRAGQDDRLFVVHRLDRPTSGVMIVARNQPTAARLSLALSEHRLDREYLALMLSPKEDTAVIEVDIDDRPARTHFSVLERRGPVSLVHARLETGRTHQVRIHAEAWGAPIWGDSKYGRRAIYAARMAGVQPSSPPPRLALHAFRLTLPEEDLAPRPSFECPLPDDLRAFWQAQTAQ